MTPEETAQLVSLLKKLKDDDLLSPKMPLEIWKAIQQVVPQPAVEVILTTTGRNFLLTYRQDDNWDGWHIPGGFMLYRESIADACNRIAQKELGISCRFEKLVDAYMWPDHPYASALSLICICHSEETPNDGEWFTEIPKMIPHQDEFIRLFLDSKKV